ncbi:hypothetical protein C5167_012273 [Papaver somniferum]|uniref:Uncharacterized protein n=1 Tax=Papaver somniferum TaxID=3469 RepID=A0A4Y7IYZ0_PAPSO|nr:hypothetical protein C5167_012273 [Papaver somniferum]
MVDDMILRRLVKSKEAGKIRFRFWEVLKHNSFTGSHLNDIDKILDWYWHLVRLILHFAKRPFSIISIFI